MEVKNHLKPHKTQIEGFLEGDTDTPITMLNLLKFKEKAFSLNFKRFSIVIGVSVSPSRNPSI